MAKTAAIGALPRERAGKGAARSARRAGRIPGVLYGHGEDSVALTVDAHSFGRLLHDVSVENTLIDLELEGREALKVLVREVQRHPYRDQVLHVDFFHISMEEKITLDVPVTLLGNPLGVRLHGGILDHSMREIGIQCLPKDIPEKVEIDVSGLDIGDSVRVGDLRLDNVQVMEDADQAIVTVVPPTVIEEVAALVPEGTGAEPEVIAKGKEEEGEEGAPAKGERKEGPPSKGDRKEAPPAKGDRKETPPAKGDRK